MADVAEGKTLLSSQSLLTLQLQTLVGNLASLYLSVENVEGITCRRSAVETQDDQEPAGFASSIRWLRSLNIALIHP